MQRNFPQRPGKFVINTTFSMLELLMSMKKLLFVILTFLFFPHSTFAFTSVTVTVDASAQVLHVAPSDYGFFGWNGSGGFQYSGNGPQDYGVSGQVGVYYFLGVSQADWNCANGTSDPFTDCGFPSDLSLWQGTATLVGSGHARSWTLGGVYPLPVPSSGGPGVVYYNMDPSITITQNFTHKTIAGIVSFDYTATDKDDVLPDHPEFHLGDAPVTFYYGRGTGDDWILLAKDLNATGTMAWDTTKLSDGDNYRIKAEVIDNGNLKGEVVQDFITIDNTRPILKVSVSPKFTQGQPVNISVKSSEVLPQPPTLTISQYKHEPMKIALVAGKIGNLFTAVYRPISGFDGPAQVVVEGADFAGNTASVVLDDADFSVGMNPPGVPVISIPNGDVHTASSTLPLISGSALNAAKITVKVNGVEAYHITDIQKNGHFSLQNIKLDPTFNKGKNVITLTSEDGAGSVSAPASVTVFVNSPPKIILLEPKNRAQDLNGLINFSWSGTDINDDPLTYQVELSNDGGTTWRTLARNLRETHFVWDSTASPDSVNYSARVTASDGSLTAVALSNRLTLSNALPIITLEESDNLFTSAKSKTIHGSVRSKKDLLVKMELSLDGEKTWKTLLPEDGAWDSAYETFSIPFTNLTIGTQEVALRGTSAQNRIVINAQGLKVTFDDVVPTFVVDKLPSGIMTTRLITLDGSAYDNFSGIKRVEYKIDDQNWYEAFLHGQLGQRSIDFTVDSKEPLADGKHTIQIRAVDRAENQSKIATQDFVIDATPPRIGSFTLTLGKDILFPDQDGVFSVIPGSKVALQVAIAGNPKTVVLKQDALLLDFTRNETTGLWQSSLTFKTLGKIHLVLSATDAVGNKTQSTLATVEVAPAEATVTSTSTTAVPAVTPRPSFFKKIVNFLHL